MLASRSLRSSSSCASLPTAWPVNWPATWATKRTRKDWAMREGRTITRHTEYRFSAASAPAVVDDANRAPQESWDALVWAFVQGVRWWEVEKTGATLWASDRNKAERAARVTLTTVMEAEKWRGINPVSPRPITSADYAKALRRIDELTFALQRTVNLIEQGLPDLARKVGLRELKKS